MTTSTDNDIERMLLELHGPTIEGPRHLAMLCVERILNAIHPKFDENWASAGRNMDGDGYVEDYEWESSEMMDIVIESLYAYGFGPKRAVESELRNLCRSRGRSFGVQDEFLTKLFSSTIMGVLPGGTQLKLTEAAAGMQTRCHRVREKIEAKIRSVESSGTELVSATQQARELRDILEALA